MQVPNWSAKQFLDQNALNTAANAVSGSMNTSVSGSLYPGLIRPDVVTVTTSGLTANITAPLPFRIMFGSGVIADAHGLITGQDSQSASASFSGVVPASGSVTAYLLASYFQIQQNAFQVVGPPPGHPDYNPNFVPTTAYQTNVDSLQFNASTGAPDNLTIFEIGRFTLAAGATGLPAMSTVFQQRAQNIGNTVSVALSGSQSLTIAANAGRMNLLSGSGVFTLPAVSGCNGLLFGFSSTSGTPIVSGAAGDQIFGSAATGVSGLGSISLRQEATAYFLGTQGSWQIVGGSPVGMGTPPILSFSGNPNGQVPGQAGIPGVSAPDLIWDTFYSTLWVCTASGSASSAIWSTVPGQVVGANGFRNATCFVAARGVSGTVTSGSATYTLDGHVITSSGASVVWSQVAGIGTSSKSLQLNCATGLTDLKWAQPIESFIAAQFKNQVVTIQQKIQNNTSSGFTPTLTFKHLVATDAGVVSGVAAPWTGASPASSVTDINAQSLQLCPSGQITTVSWTFTGSSGVSNGVLAQLDFGGALNSATGNIVVGDPDIRQTPLANAGLNANPPAFTPRYPSDEQFLCARYLPVFNADPSDGVHGVVFPGGDFSSSSTQGATAGQFITKTRIAPKAIVISAAGDFAISTGGEFIQLSTLTFTTAGTIGAELAFTVAGGGAADQSVWLAFNDTSASLYFTGAEL